MKGFDLLGVYSARLVQPGELVVSGHRACQGCGEVLAMRLIHKELGPNTITATATGCMEIISSSYPDTAWGIPWIHVAFENAAAVASGVEAGYQALRRKGKLPDHLQDKKITFVGMGGDGATADIGLQALSGALERGHDMIYVCYDNEAYMNTGIQRSSSTPYGASTTTSPAGKVSIGQQTWKKNITEIAAAHRIPYAATASPSFPFDLMEKARRAAETPGPAYLHVYSACPTGWRCASNLAIELGRLAAQSGAFPIYEIYEGSRVKVNVKPGELRPLKDYLKSQGRFRHLDDEVIAEAEGRLRADWERLLERERQSGWTDEEKD
jgi:pyruvate ferredoxin oxidoreductase beta subunit